MQKSQKFKVNSDIQKVRSGIEPAGSSLKRQNSQHRQKAFNPPNQPNKDNISGTGKDKKSQVLGPVLGPVYATKDLSNRKYVHPFGNPTNTSQTKKSVYEYLTSKATQAGTYSTRLARINPEKLSKLSGDGALNYLKGNFTSVKALEIKNFFNNELKGMNNAGEKAKKIKTILQNFAKDASTNNTIKKNMMSNISTFKNKQETLNNTKRRKTRSKRTNEIEKELLVKPNTQLPGFNDVPEYLKKDENSYVEMSNDPPPIFRNLKPLNTVKKSNVTHRGDNSYVDMRGMKEYNELKEALSQSTPVSTKPEVSGSNSRRRPSVSSQDGNNIALTPNPLYESSNSNRGEGKYGYSPVIPFRKTLLTQPTPPPILLTNRNASGYVKPQPVYVTPVALSKQIYTQPETQNSIPNSKISRNKTPLAPPTPEELLSKSNNAKVRANEKRQLVNNAKRIAARRTQKNPSKYNKVLKNEIIRLEKARGLSNNNINKSKSTVVTAPPPTYNTVDKPPTYNTVDKPPTYNTLDKPDPTYQTKQQKNKQKNINPFTNPTKDINPVYSTLGESNFKSKKPTNPTESIYSTLRNAGVRQAQNAVSHKKLLEALENGSTRAIAKSEIKRAKLESERAKLESERQNRLKQTAIASGYTTASAVKAEPVQKTQIPNSSKLPKAKQIENIQKQIKEVQNREIFDSLNNFHQTKDLQILQEQLQSLQTK
jgi:hypothetical protein